MYMFLPVMKACSIVCSIHMSRVCVYAYGNQRNKSATIKKRVMMKNRIKLSTYDYMHRNLNVHIYVDTYITARKCIFYICVMDICVYVHAGLYVCV